MINCIQLYFYENLEEIKFLEKSGMEKIFYLKKKEINNFYL